MNRATRGSGFFADALKFFKRKPARTASGADRASSARVASQSPAGAQRGAAAPYRAAQIVCDGSACESARALSGIRFLAREVPRLPLPECTHRPCRCSYIRHTDRRNLSDERRAQFSVRTKLYAAEIGNDERRRKYGRRAGEKAGSAARYEFKSGDF